MKLGLGSQDFAAGSQACLQLFEKNALIIDFVNHVEGQNKIHFFIDSQIVRRALMELNALVNTGTSCPLCGSFEHF